MGWRLFRSTALLLGAIVVSLGASASCGLQVTGEAGGPPDQSDLDSASSGDASSSSSSSGANGNGSEEGGIASNADASIDATVEGPPDGSALDASDTTDATTDVGVQNPTSWVAITQSAAPNTNLTTQGTIDWVYWAYDGNAASVARKGNGSSVITSPYGLTGSSLRFVFDVPASVNYTWTDGALPSVTGSSDEYTFFKAASDLTITLKAAATTLPRSFTFVAGVVGSKTTIEARLSDDSASDSEVHEIAAGAKVRAVTVSYSSATPGKDLIVRWHLDQIYEPATAGITLGAAWVK
jgi:hypothetical protein